jgi:hypothetical protein
VNCLHDSPLISLHVNNIPLLRVYYLYVSIFLSSLICIIYLIYSALLCKKYFKCHKATNSQDHVGLLFLSKNRGG